MQVFPGQAQQEACRGWVNAQEQSQRRSPGRSARLTPQSAHRPGENQGEQLLPKGEMQVISRLFPAGGCPRQRAEGREQGGRVAAQFKGMLGLGLAAGIQHCGAIEVRSPRAAQVQLEGEALGCHIAPFDA